MHMIKGVYQLSHPNALRLVDIPCSSHSITSMWCMNVRRYFINIFIVKIFSIMPIALASIHKKLQSHWHKKAREMIDDSHLCQLWIEGWESCTVICKNRKPSLDNFSLDEKPDMILLLTMHKVKEVDLLIFQHCYWHTKEKSALLTGWLSSFSAEFFLSSFQLTLLSTNNKCLHSVGMFSIQKPQLY